MTPDRDVHRDRGRAEGFGAAAESYDTFRPTYPRALISWLGAAGIGTAADIGSGTGQVARLLGDAGWQVIGVEPDERMASVASRHGVDVVVSRFEDWRPGRRFDLVCSGQAWHWIDPDVGYRRAAEVLRPGGRLALFWNSYHYDADTSAVFTAVFGRRAPHLLVDSVPLGTASPDHAALDADAIRRSAAWFEGPDFRVFRHGRRQQVDDWIAEAGTHSPIAMLSDEMRAALLGDVRAALLELNRGHVDVAYDTRVTSAVRR
jgi:SAM-dependent methyltransferase